MQRLTRKTIHKFKFNNDEPASQGPNFITDRIGIINAFNWYNENGDITKLRNAVEVYCNHKYPHIVDSIKSLKDNQITMTMCAIARMYLGGVVLPPDIVMFLDRRIEEIATLKKTDDPDTAPKETYNQVIADFDEMLDDFYRSDYSMKPLDFYEHLTVLSPRTKDIAAALKQYAVLLDEDYKHLTAKQKKAYLNFVQSILNDCSAYLGNARKQTKLRKPRKKKLKSAEQLASKVRFKESDTELKLTSVTPASIVGAHSVWLFNTKTRKITYLEGDKLSIKGTTIIDFDTDKSFSKIIRKPETLADLLNTPRAKMLKDIRTLKTKATPANGRLSADVLILRANK